MEEKKNNKKILFSVVAILLLVVVVLGATYAYFRAVGQSAEQEIASAKIKLSFDDSIDIINADKLMPIYESQITTSNKVAKKTFSITSNESTRTQYVTLELSDIKIDNELSDKNFRWALYENNKLVTTFNLDNIKTGDTVELYTNIVLPKNTTKTFDLYIYLVENDEDQSSMMNKTFSAKIKASGYLKQAEPEYGKVDLLSNLVAGEFAHTSNGTFLSSTDSHKSFSRTNYIEVDDSKVLFFYANEEVTLPAYIPFYDESKTVISTAAVTGLNNQSDLVVYDANGEKLYGKLIEIPDNAKYFVLNVDTNYNESDSYKFYYVDKNKMKQLNYSFNGLKVSILGDSISTLKGYIPEVNRPRYVQTETEAVDGLLYMPYEKTWWGGVIEELNMELGINESWAGSRVSNTSTTDTGDVGPNRSISSMTRIQALDDNGTPDVIFFFGGTNDIGKSVTLGTFNKNLALNTEETIFDNFADAYAMTILRMQSLYPDARIISILPTHTTSYYTEEKLLQYNAVIKQICDYYNIKYIDLNKSSIALSHLSDGIHPNAEGMSIMTNYILKELYTQEKTNLYQTSEVLDGYYNTLGKWEETAHGVEQGGAVKHIVSVIENVKPGDKLVANSFCDASLNGSDDLKSGIRITYLLDNTRVSSLAPDKVYDEFTTNGYLTVPAGVNQVNVAWWGASDYNYLYIN